MKKVLITAALPYVNYLPHLGHIVGCHLPADIFYRFNRAIGNDAVFIGGSDCYGTATLLSAKEYGVSPETLVEKFSNIHRQIYKKLNISYSINSATSACPYHKQIVQEFYNKLKDNDLIEQHDDSMLFCEKDKIALADRFIVGTCPFCGYDQAYGDQCDACGKTYNSDELLDPKCKFCGESAVRKSTKHLYLKLNQLSQQLEHWIESKENIWRPHVVAEAKRWLREGLKSRCITRDISWGIPVPEKGFQDKVFYVWFDAPIGYISMTKELGGDAMIDKYWKSDCEIYNFIGKDNIPFHAVFFPAMVMGSKEYNLAHNVVGFNFLNFEGQKFSKSKKIGVFCDGILESDIDIDTLRAYLVTVFPENKDSDFKWEGYKDNTNSELVGKYGNFFNRTINMLNKNFNGNLEWALTSQTSLNDFDKEMIACIEEYPNKIAKLFQATEFREAYKAIMNFASVGNGYLEKSAPWTMIKNGDIEGAKKVLYLCLCMAKNLAIVAAPIIPTRAQEIFNQLGFSEDVTKDGIWNETGKIDIASTHKVNPPQPLFARIDDARLEDLKTQLTKTADIKKLIFSE